MKKFLDKFFSIEWLAWVFLAVCIIINFATAASRRPKIVRDDVGYLSSKVEKQIKKYNKTWDDKYDGVRIAVSFLKKDTDPYDYYTDLDLGKNGYLVLFIVKDDEMIIKERMGPGFERLLKSDLDLSTGIRPYKNFVHMNFVSGNTGEINRITGDFYDKVNDLFEEKFHDKSVLEKFLEGLGLSGSNDQNPAVTDDNEITEDDPDAESGVIDEDDDEERPKGFFGMIWWVLTFPFRMVGGVFRVIITIVIIFVIVNIFRGLLGGGGGGGGNRIG